MTQNRKAPAYQEYAAPMLADKQFRLMSLEERGLLFSMRLECWVNNDVPAQAESLAKYLGQNCDAVQRALTPQVLSFFKKQGSVLICPELENYRQHLNERSARQSEGGKKGAAKVNSASKAAKALIQSTGAIPPSASPGKPPTHPQVSREQTGPHSNSEDHEKWLDDYERASNGG